MDNSRLIIHICERIIDIGHLFEREDDGWVHYRYWCTTALVCSAWRPRSQFDLYQKIRLRQPDQVRRLLEGLASNPTLAESVKTLIVGGHFTPNSGEFIPFGQNPLPRLLRSCTVLDMVWIKWTFYPPRYANIYFDAWAGAPITTLSIRLSGRVFYAQLRFIRSLPSLKDLLVSGLSMGETRIEAFPRYCRPAGKATTKIRTC